MNRDNLDKVVTGGAGLIIGLVLFVPGFIAGMANGITIDSRLGAPELGRSLSH